MVSEDFTPLGSEDLIPLGERICNLLPIELNVSGDRYLSNKLEMHLFNWGGMFAGLYVTIIIPLGRKITITSGPYASWSDLSFLGKQFVESVAYIHHRLSTCLVLEGDPNKKSRLERELHELPDIFSIPTPAYLS